LLQHKLFINFPGQHAPNLQSGHIFVTPVANHEHSLANKSTYLSLPESVPSETGGGTVKGTTS